jgi:Trypsin
MTEEFQFRPGFVMPKQIYRTNEVLRPGTVCLAAGFGRTKTDADNYPERTLYFLPMPILEAKVCKKWVSDVRDTEICTGLPYTGSGLCSGDSGGPLICRGRIYAVNVAGPECKQGARNTVNLSEPLWNVREFIDQYVPQKEGQP